MKTSTVPDVDAPEELEGWPLYVGAIVGSRVPGVNVDHIDVSAGLRALASLGWDARRDRSTFMVIEYALQRWARGEEAAAQRGAIGQGETDPRFKAAAIDFTSWRFILAAARAAGEAAAR